MSASDVEAAVTEAAVGAVDPSLPPAVRSVVAAEVDRAVSDVWTRLPARDRCFAALGAGAIGLALGFASAVGRLSFALGTWGMALAGCAASVLPSVCPWIRSRLSA